MNMLDREKIKKMMEIMPEHMKEQYKKLMTHKENYEVDGKLYSAVVDFLNETVSIVFGTSEIFKDDLKVYESFKGNMEMFVKAKTKIIYN